MTAMGKKILVVDDELDIIELIGFFLKNYGFEVIPALSVLEGKRKLALQKVDLVISDIRMPGPSGFELLAHIRLSYPNIPFLFISGFSDMSVEEALALGAKGIVRKPWEEGELVRLVTSICPDVTIKEAVQEETHYPLL